MLYLVFHNYLTARFCCFDEFCACYMRYLFLLIRMVGFVVSFFNSLTKLFDLLLG